jgi:hypothetical protein
MSLAIVMATKKTLRGKVFERNGDVDLSSAGVAPAPLAAPGPPGADGSHLLRG